MALVGTLIVRLISGPLCDQFGPRYVFAGCLIAEAIPTTTADLVTTPTGLIVLRFDICYFGRVFRTLVYWYFRQECCRTANGLAGGWGNSGGGITVSRHL